MNKERSFDRSSVFFDDLQISSTDFYNAVERTLIPYQYPDLRLFRTTFKQGGMFSANREYFVIQRGNDIFYLCAAPFGRSFFVSWWFETKQSDMSALLEMIPFIGKRLAANNDKKTFYEIDTEAIFRSAIKKLIDANIAELEQNKGFRPYNQQEHPALAN